MRRRKFACALLIDTLGQYLLQARDNIPNIVQPGKISLFGGHCEDGETFIQCVVREVCEETGLVFGPTDFKLIGTYQGADLDVGEGEYTGAFFVARDVPTDQIVITEGALLIVKPHDLPSIQGELTPITRMLLSRLKPGPEEHRRPAL